MGKTLVAIRFNGGDEEVQVYMPHIPRENDTIQFPRYDPESYGDNRPEWWYYARVVSVRWFVGRDVKFPHNLTLKEVMVYCDVLEIKKP